MTPTTKPTRLFSRASFSLFALIAALSSAVLLAGCATTDSNSDTRISDHSQHHH